MAKSSDCIVTILIADMSIAGIRDISCINRFRFHWTEKQTPAHEYLNVLGQFETTFYLVFLDPL